jgi:ABC-type transport system substrate-binding protein
VAGVPRIWLSTHQAPMDDVRCAAINYAIDKEPFLATVYKGTR